MKIYYDDATLGPTIRTENVRPWVRPVSIVLLLLIALAIGVATFRSVRMSERARFSVPIRTILLDTAIFDQTPGKNTAEIINQTALDEHMFQRIAADDARIANSQIRFVHDIGPAARPLIVPLGDGLGFMRALDCMTAAIYYEAANEPAEGQRAVAQVVLNRVRHLAYPKTVCGVVFQGSERRTGCQFSFTCDGSLGRTPSPAGWLRARAVASAALSGQVFASVGLATHYHADYVVPDWASTLAKQRMIGRHIFYRWPGTWGKPVSFAAAYDAHEPAPWKDGKSYAALPPAPDMAGIMGNSTTYGMESAAGRPVIMPAPARNGDRAYLAEEASTSPGDTPRKSGVTGGAILMPGAPHP